MPPTSWKKPSSALAERFASALPERSNLVRKLMFGYPAAFTGGNMVCGLFQESVVVRLGKEGAKAAIAEKGATQFAPMPGRIMTGYVLVPVADIESASALAPWLQLAFEYAQTLPKKVPKSISKATSTTKRGAKQ